MCRRVITRLRFEYLSNYEMTILNIVVQVVAQETSANRLKKLLALVQALFVDFD